MAARRDKGEGSVFRRASDGKWVARLTVPRDISPSGRITRIAATQREARQLLAALKRELAAGQLGAGASQPLRVYLTDWLEGAVRPRRRPKTYVGYKTNVERHLIPALGDVPLGRLTTRQVRDLLNDLLAGGLAPRTVQYVHAVLRVALNHAVDEGLVPINVAARVDAPSVTREEVEPLSVEQARRFLVAVAGHRLEAVYRVAIAVGLRRGEICGLSWTDIDLAAGRLTVRRTLGRVEGQLRFDPPKSRRSRRTLALPAQSVAALRAHRVLQAQEQRLAGDRWVEHGLVFPSAIGTPLEPRNLLRHFQATCVTLGLLRANGKPFRFHDLRHTAASFLLAQGVPLRVVMEILGHSQIGLTADTYSHVAPEVQAAAAERMDDLLRQLDGGAGTDDRAPTGGGADDRVSDGVPEADDGSETPADEDEESAD
jgi:integrase